MIHDVPHLRHNHKTLNLAITKFEQREKCHMACIWAIEVAWGNLNLKDMNTYTLVEWASSEESTNLCLHLFQLFCSPHRIPPSLTTSSTTTTTAAAPTTSSPPAAATTTTPPSPLWIRTPWHGRRTSSTKTSETRSRQSHHESRNPNLERADKATTSCCKQRPASNYTGTQRTYGWEDTQGSSKVQNYLTSAEDEEPSGLVFGEDTDELRTYQL